MGDLSDDYQPFTPATPTESERDPEEEFNNLHISKIFREQRNTFLHPDQLDQDFSSVEKWSPEKILKKCHSEYVSTFSARIEVYETGNRIPVLPDSLLQEIHKDSQKSSFQLYDFIFKCREHNDNAIKQQLETCLEKLCNLIVERNRARQLQLVESVENSEKNCFLKCLKQRYAWLYENKNPAENNLEAFYDSTQLVHFVNAKKMVHLERFKVLVQNIFVSNSQHHDDTIDTVKNKAIADMGQWMTQQGFILTQKNDQNENKVKKRIHDWILTLKNFLDELRKTVDNLYFDEVEKEIKFKLETIQPKIEEICRNSVVQNYKEMYQKYQVETENVCEEYIYTLKIFRVGTFLHDVKSGFKGYLQQQAQKNKISLDLLGDQLPKLVEYSSNQSTVEAGSHTVENQQIINSSFATPGGIKQLETTNSESGDESDATVILDQSLNAKRNLKRNLNASRGQGCNKLNERGRDEVNGERRDKVNGQKKKKS